LPIRGRLEDFHGETPKNLKPNYFNALGSGRRTLKPVYLKKWKEVRIFLALHGEKERFDGMGKQGVRHLLLHLPFLVISFFV